jgi:hypothetical protein
MANSSIIIWVIFVIFKITAQNKQSPNRRNFDQLGHPGPNGKKPGTIINFFLAVTVLKYTKSYKNTRSQFYDFFIRRKIWRKFWRFSLQLHTANFAEKNSITF